MMQLTRTTNQPITGKISEAQPTNLDGGVLAGGHHDGEGGVEDDTGDGTAMAHQGVLLWGAWDPLPRTASLTVRSPCVELSLRLRQLRLQVHHLATRCHGNRQLSLSWVSS